MDLPLSLPVPLDGPYFGSLDAFTQDGRLIGWAIPNKAPSPSLEIVDGGEVIMTLKLDRPRPDVENIYPGHTHPGFDVDLRPILCDGTTHSIDLRDPATRRSVLSEPLRLVIPAPVKRPRLLRSTPTVAVRALRERYIELMKHTLANTIYGDGSTLPHDSRDSFDFEKRKTGMDWPQHAHTMIGLERLDNVLACIENVLADDVPGDLIEAGVWRGGASIFMRGVLAAYDVRDRKVWVADSFCGLPPPDAQRYPADAGDALHTFSDLAVSLETVRGNFAAYDLLDEQVRFVPGWFRDTLPTLGVERLAVLRLDGDMYESTIVALEALYPKLSVGGFAIIDDYGALPTCRQAVHDYRLAHGIRDEIVPIDWTGVCWRKSASAP